MIFFSVPTLIFLLCAVPVSVSDIRTMHIPSWLTYAGCAVLFAYMYAADRPNLAAGLGGAAAIFIVFLLLRKLTHDGMGAGDVKYSLLCGLYCGFPCVFAGCALAAVGGLLYFAVFHMIARNVPIKNVKIPFAPFMTAGTLAAACIVGKFI